MIWDRATIKKYMLMKNLNSLNRVTGRNDQGVYREFEMALMGKLEAWRRPTETRRLGAGSFSFSGSSVSPGPRLDEPGSKAPSRERAFPTACWPDGDRRS